MSCMYALRGLDDNGVLLYLLFNVYMSALHNQDGDNRISIDEFVGYFSDRVNTGEWPGQACCPDVCMYVWCGGMNSVGRRLAPSCSCCSYGHVLCQSHIHFQSCDAMRCVGSAGGPQEEGACGRDHESLQGAHARSGVQSKTCPAHIHTVHS